MFRRVALLFAVLILVSSMSFGLPSGCANFLCFQFDDTSSVCSQSLQNGIGDRAGCVTVRLMEGGYYYVTYCQSVYCYYV